MLIPLSHSKHAELVKKTEAEARQMMTAADWSIDNEDWIAAFGATEAELRSLENTLARRFHAIPRRKRQEREAVLRHYVSVHAMLTVGRGLITRWQ